MAKRSSSAKPSTRITIPDDQLDLPVSFDSSGNLVTLREAMQKDHPPMLSPGSLCPEKKAELTVKRIEAQPQFQIAMIGAGLVDKERAIREVRAGTAVGHQLVEIEQRMINTLLKEVPTR